MNTGMRRPSRKPVGRAGPGILQADGKSGPVLRENPSLSPEQRKKAPEPDDLFRVVIIDNDHNTYQEVIDICMLALGVDFQHAYRIALAVDNNGEAEVAHAGREDAQEIARVIRSIGIEVRVLPISNAQ